MLDSYSVTMPGPKLPKARTTDLHSNRRQLRLQAEPYNQFDARPTFRPLLIGSLVKRFHDRLVVAAIRAECCVVVLIEALHSPRCLSAMGLRIASSLERQLEVPSLNRERIKLSADSGAGIVQPSDVRNGVG